MLYKGILKVEPGLDVGCCVERDTVFKILQIFFFVDKDPANIL